MVAIDQKIWYNTNVIRVLIILFGGKVCIS